MVPPKALTRPFRSYMGEYRIYMETQKFDFFFQENSKLNDFFLKNWNHSSKSQHAPIWWHRGCIVFLWGSTSSLFCCWWYLQYLLGVGIRRYYWYLKYCFFWSIGIDCMLKYLISVHEIIGRFYRCQILFLFCLFSSLKCNNSKK